MASVYVLYSKKLNKFYTGSCLDLQQRILEHENKVFYNSFTAAADDWHLYFDMSDLDGTVARKMEAHIKSMKSKQYIQNLKKYPEISLKLLTKFSR